MGRGGGGSVGAHTFQPPSGVARNGRAAADYTRTTGRTGASERMGETRGTRTVNCVTDCF